MTGVAVWAIPAALALAAGWGSACAQPDLGVAIDPPRIEKLVKAGSSHTDAVAYTNNGKVPVVVSVSLVDFNVDEGGELVELPPGTEPDSAAPIFRIAPLSMRVEPGQRVHFRYQVETPEDYNQRKAMIFFDSMPELGDSSGRRVVFTTAMGVAFYVENPKADPGSLRIDDFRWERSAKRPDQVVLKARVSNEGSRNIRPSGYVQVRSPDGDFLETFDFNIGSDVVLPGNSRRWEMSFGPVPAGELIINTRFTTSPRTSHSSEDKLPAAGE